MNHAKTNHTETIYNNLYNTTIKIMLKTGRCRHGGRISYQKEIIKTELEIDTTIKTKSDLFKFHTRNVG